MHSRRRQWQPTLVLLPGKSHGQRSLVGCSPWAYEGQTQLRDFTFTFQFHALEKEMATHSSVLAWRIPGTAEPGGLPSVGSHRVGHNWSDLAAAAVFNKTLLDTSRKNMNNNQEKSHLTKMVRNDRDVQIGRQTQQSRCKMCSNTERKMWTQWEKKYKL